MQELNASALVSFIIKELRCMQSEMVIDQALGKTTITTPEISKNTCLSEFIKELTDNISKQTDLAKSLSYKEGKYDAYKNILEIIQKQTSK